MAPFFRMCLGFWITGSWLQLWLSWLCTFPGFDLSPSATFSPSHQLGVSRQALFLPHFNQLPVSAGFPSFSVLPPANSDAFPRPHLLPLFETKASRVPFFWEAFESRIMTRVEKQACLCSAANKPMSGKLLMLGINILIEICCSPMAFNFKTGD